MIESNATFNQHLTQNMEPVWLLEFDESTTFFSSGEFSDISASYIQAIEDVNYYGFLTTPIKDNVQETYATIKLTDEQGQMLSFIANRSLMNKVAYLKFGFKGINQSDFITRFIGKIDSINFVDWQLAEITVSSFWPKEKDRIFLNASSSKTVGNFPSGYFRSTNLQVGGTGYQTLISARSVSNLNSGDYIFADAGLNKSFVEIQETYTPSLIVMTGTLPAWIGYNGALLSNSRIKVNDASFFFTGLSEPKSPFQDGFYVQIGQESILTSGRSNYSASQNWIEIKQVHIWSNYGRGFFGTETVAHSSGSQVKELFVMRDNVIDFPLKVMLSTSLGTNSTYDTGINSWGAGIPQSFVDIDGFESLRFTYFSTASDSNQYQLQTDSQESLDDVLLNDFFAPLWLMPYINNLGKISVKHINNSAVDTVGEQDLTMTAPKYNIQDFFNRVEIKYDYVQSAGKYYKEENYSLLDSVSEYGESKPFKLSSKALRSDRYGDVFISSFLYNMVTRYANPVVSVDMQMKMHKVLLEQGDWVEITANDWPNIKTGTRGVGDLLGQITDIHIQGFDRINATVELDRVIDFIDASGSVVKVVGDTATKSSDGTALIEAADAGYYNVSGVNANFILVSFKAYFSGADNIALRVYLCDGFDAGVGSSVTVTEYKNSSLGRSSYGTEYGFVVFTAPISDYDIKLDYYAALGSNVSEVEIVQIGYTTINSSYTKIS